MLSRQRFTQIVGENIRKIRTRKDMSQEGLAAEAKFYRTYINLVETAKRSPSAYNLHRIAKALKVSVTDIYPK